MGCFTSGDCFEKSCTEIKKRCIIIQQSVLWVNWLVVKAAKLCQLLFCVCLIVLEGSKVGRGWRVEDLLSALADADRVSREGRVRDKTGRSAGVEFTLFAPFATKESFV
jgi:hypothetical protein